jgi:hypothetical protein
VNASASDWRRLRNILLLLLALSFCLYLPTLFHYAFADDEIYLAYMNRFLREASWAELYQLFLKPANPWEFLPLRDFTYWLDFRLYGDETSGFHATNLLWYALSVSSSFCFFRELVLLCKPAWAARATVLALCGAVVFMVHPAHVEVAAWIASRKDLIAASFSFFSLALLARALRAGWSALSMSAAALLLFAACFGKASAMTSVLVATALFGMAWKAAPEVGRGKRVAWLLLFWSLLALAFLIHLHFGEARGIRIENHPGLWVMLDRASRILVAQTGILLFPYPLHFYHDVYRLGDWHWLVSGSAALLVLAALWVLSRRRALWALGVVLAFAPLVVYLQLLPFTTWSLASERFAFVSVAGVALILIDLCGRIGEPNKIAVLLLIVVLPSALIVWSRVGEWEYRNTLLEREYALQPEFHNTIRDRIGFTLLPEKRYAEAAALASQLPRPYAVDVLLALIDTEQAYRAMRDPSGLASDTAALRQNFCRAVTRLRSANSNAYARIPQEPDLSYNNILRTVDQALKLQFGDEKQLCAAKRP